MAIEKITGTVGKDFDDKLTAKTNKGYTPIWASQTIIGDQQSICLETPPKLRVLKE